MDATEAFREAINIVRTGWDATQGVVIPALVLIIGIAFIFEQRR